MLLTDATNLPRLMACNGSRLMEGAERADDVEYDTTIRDEGNAAHYMARAVFNHEFNIEELIERKAPNGVYMTPEMNEHVQQYLDQITGFGDVEVDTSFGTEAWRVNSRADHIWYDDNGTNTLFIDELKYGWRIVEPQDNWTMIWHAIGYCITRQIQPAQIEFTVHQPRPFHPDGKRRFTHLTYSQLLERYQEIDRTLTNPSDTLNTGPWCDKCPAIGTCPAARLARMNGIDIANQKAFTDTVTNEQLSFDVDQMRRAISLLESCLKASEDLIMYRLRNGQVIDNYSIEMSLSNTQWKHGITADTLLALTGQNYAVQKLPTPKQAKKAGAPANVVDLLTERVPTGAKLVRVSADKKAKRLLGDKADDQN